MLSSIYTLLFTASIPLATGTVTDFQYAASTTAAMPSNPVVTIKNGSYSGIYNPTYNQDFFLGIPYAQPPINDLRFRVPQSLNETWTGMSNATAYPPFCVGYGFDDIGFDLAEDCLYLNVVRPSASSIPSNASFPIALWIHGGGLRQGGTADQRYNLSFIVQNSVEMNKPIIGVSIQYRLSAWGFLAGKEVLDEGVANLGYRDQRLALQWVQENIGAFGGDKSKVTIWGESAGAQSVGAQLLAYNGRDDGLFRAAIAQSGGPGVSYFPSQLPQGFNSTFYQSLYNTLISNTTCAPALNTSSSLSCLRALPFNELNTALNISEKGFGPMVPMIDNDFITTYASNQLSSGNFVKVPLLIGASTDEGTAFGAGKGPNGKGVNTDAEWLQELNLTGISPTSASAQIVSYLYPNIQALGIPSLTTYPEVIQPNSTAAQARGLQWRRVAAYFGDVVVIAPRRLTNHAWSKFNVPNWSYRFDVKPSTTPSISGATHFQEVAFVFNITRGGGYNSSPFSNLTDAEEETFGKLAVHE